MQKQKVDVKSRFFGFFNSLNGALSLFATIVGLYIFFSGKASCNQKAFIGKDLFLSPRLGIEFLQQGQKCEMYQNTDKKTIKVEVVNQFIEIQFSNRKAKNKFIKIFLTSDPDVLLIYEMPDSVREDDIPFLSLGTCGANDEFPSTLFIDPSFSMCNCFSAEDLKKNDNTYSLTFSKVGKLDFSDKKGDPMKETSIVNYEGTLYMLVYFDESELDDSILQRGNLEIFTLSF